MLGFTAFGNCKCRNFQEKLTFHNNDSLKCHILKYFFSWAQKTQKCHIIPEGLSYIYIYIYAQVYLYLSITSKSDKTDKRGDRTVSIAQVCAIPMPIRQETPLETLAGRHACVKCCMRRMLSITFRDRILQIFVRIHVFY